MSYLSFIDNLPKAGKIVLAIFINPLFIAYRFVKDVLDEAWLLVLFDVIFCFVVPIVFWILDLIWIAEYDKVFTFAEWFGVDDVDKWKTKNNLHEDKSDNKDGTIEVEVVDKK